MKYSVLCLVTLLVTMAIISSSPTTSVEGADCYSNGWACQDGGCYRNGGYCMTVRRRKGRGPICRCVKRFGWRTPMLSSMVKHCYTETQMNRTFSLSITSVWLLLGGPLLPPLLLPPPLPLSSTLTLCPHLSRSRMAISNNKFHKCRRFFHKEKRSDRK